MFLLIELQSPQVPSSDNHGFTFVKDPLCKGPWSTLQPVLTHLSPQPPYHVGAIIISRTDEETEAGSQRLG